MSTKVQSRIFPVPTYMFKDNTMFKVYKALLESADEYGRIYITNDQIAQMVGVRATSSSITTCVNKLKSMGVVERVRKKGRNDKIGLTRILQLCYPYDKLAPIFQKRGSLNAVDFLEVMRNL